FWSVLAFAVYGALIGRRFDHSKLGVVIPAATAAGILLAASFTTVSSLDTHYMKLAAILVLAGAEILDKGILVRSALMPLPGVVLAIWLPHQLSPKIISTSKIQEFTSLDKVYFPPMIRTDMYYSKGQDRYFLFTNGTRAAKFPRPNDST